MFLTRVFGRALFSAASKSEASAAAAAAYSTATHNLLEDFFEVDRKPDDDTPVVYGRSWKASELRLKSWDDLNKLWYDLNDSETDASCSELALPQSRAYFEGAQVNVLNQTCSNRESYRRCRS